MKIRPQQVGFMALGIVGLAISYVFQYTDFLFLLTNRTFQPEAHFIVNRIVRIVTNDISMISFIYGLFQSLQILKLAIFIQVVDLFILLPIYLALKLSQEGISELSSPFLSQLHRLIVNPTLLILLIPAVIYQHSGRK